MELNINEVKATAPNVFDNNFYDTILAAVILLFGKNHVTVDEKMGKIYIQDRINLTLSLSWNEPKIYFWSFIFKGEVPEKLFKNRTFRLMSTDPIIEYLYIKRDENKYITDNEE